MIYQALIVRSILPTQCDDSFDKKTLHFIYLQLYNYSY